MVDKIPKWIKLLLIVVAVGIIINSIATIILIIQVAKLAVFLVNFINQIV